MRLTNLALHPFRAATEVPDPRRVAVRASGGQWRRATAVVAPERGAGLVVHERSLAIGTRLDVTAVAAEHDRRRPAPIEHEDGLITGRGVEGGERIVQHGR